MVLSKKILKSGIELWVKSTYSKGASYVENEDLHREDGPAAVCDRFEAWWQHGQCHRLDGPAQIIKYDPMLVWYIRGIKWWSQ